jgi:hypothetical protein
MTLTLSLLPDSYAVVRYPASVSLPDWWRWDTNVFSSCTLTPDELSLVCPETWVPENTQAQRDWCAFRIEGTLDFALVGIIARISTLLAEANISIFVLSTYDTDYILVQTSQASVATEALRSAGYVMHGI